MNNANIYAQPKTVYSVDECDFYHFMDIPGHGSVKGKWDLRGGVDQYLGGVDFKEKRVLELGPASGFLSFEMEKRGADVVTYDIGKDQEWDMVPFCQYDYRKRIREFKPYCQRMQNAFWYAHKAYQSKVKAVYGSIYDIPEEIGSVDIGTFCSILLHLRDPFRVLENALRLVKDTVIVTDLAPKRDLLSCSVDSFRRTARLAAALLLRRHKIMARHKRPYMEFLPNFRTLEHKDVWWSLSPEIIVNFLGVFGFEKTRITYHYHTLYGKRCRLFTVVGERRRR